MIQIAPKSTSILDIPLHHQGLTVMSIDVSVIMIQDSTSS